MKVLGIDAGSSKTGLALIEFVNNQPVLQKIKKIRLDVAPYKNMDVSDRLHVLFLILSRIIRKTKPDVVVVEKIRCNGGGFNLDSYLISARSQQVVETAALINSIPVTSVLAVTYRSIAGLRKRKRAEVKQESIRLVNGRFGTTLPKLGRPSGLLSSDDDVADAVLIAASAAALKARQSPSFSFTLD